MLGVVDSFRVLEGLPVARFCLVKSVKDLFAPCFLKADLAAHKTEQKAVLKCDTIQEAVDNYTTLREKFPENRIIAQYPASGIEMILGLKEDSVFGKLLMIGFGGTNAEVLKDVSFRALPVNKKEIEKMIKELKLYPSLVTRKKYAVDKLVALADNISKLDVKEMDLNPVIVNEKEVIIVDARIEPAGNFYSGEFGEELVVEGK